MHRQSILFTISIYFILFSVGCSNKEQNDYDIYSFLAICYEDFYEAYDVNIKNSLTEFEEVLLYEKRIKDTTGKSYKALLNSLTETDYFLPPYTKEKFNPVLLYKNPTNILNCAITTFTLDSIAIGSTSYAKVEREIAQKIAQSKNVSIHHFFHIYKTELTNKEIKMPYIKENILLLLYRWYYNSKVKHQENQSSH